MHGAVTDRPVESPIILRCERRPNMTDRHPDESRPRVIRSSRRAFGVPAGSLSGVLTSDLPLFSRCPPECAQQAPPPSFTLPSSPLCRDRSETLAEFQRPRSRRQHEQETDARREALRRRRHANRILAERR